MEQTQGNTGSFNAVEYGPGQAARDAEHDALKTDELTEPRALNTDPLTAAVTPDNAVMPDPVAPVSSDDTVTGEFTVTEMESDDGAIADEELRQFEKRIDDILATGELDETLRVIDAKGVAQVLPYSIPNRFRICSTALRKSAAAPMCSSAPRTASPCSTWWNTARKTKAHARRMTRRPEKRLRSTPRKPQNSQQNESSEATTVRAPLHT